MLYTLMILVVIACILLIFVVLAQSPKGGALSGSFGGAATNFLGARQGADFMEKATWYLSSGILVIVIFTYFFTSGGNNTATQKAKVSSATNYPVSGSATPTATPTAPAQPTAPAK
jgi:preprotein translocase subunit SecG